MAKRSRNRRASKRAPGSRSAPYSTRICNLVPSKGTETDWTLTNAVSSGAITAAAALPASVDLRAAWWTVGDQGATGSCVGRASAEGVTRYHMVQASTIAKNVQLSPRFTWMGSKETDAFVARPQTFIEEAGTQLKAAMDILRKYGAALMTQLPFNISTLMYGGRRERVLRELRAA